MLVTPVSPRIGFIVTLLPCQQNHKCDCHVLRDPSGRFPLQQLFSVDKLRLVKVTDDLRPYKSRVLRLRVQCEDATTAAKSIHKFNLFINDWADYFRKEPYSGHVSQTPAPRGTMVKGLEEFSNAFNRIPRWFHPRKPTLAAGATDCFEFKQSPEGNWQLTTTASCKYSPRTTAVVIAKVKPGGQFLPSLYVTINVRFGREKPASFEYPAAAAVSDVTNAHYSAPIAEHLRFRRATRQQRIWVVHRTWNGQLFNVSTNVPDETFSFKV